MPHLEENLRYAITREEKCLSEDELFVRFPGAASRGAPGLQARSGESRGTASLIPAGLRRRPWDDRRAPSGVWAEHQLRGRLDVKLGGKNMTFYQTVTALPLGACMLDSE